MNDKGIAVIQKQNIMKIIIWWQESYKILTRIWKCEQWNEMFAQWLFFKLMIDEFWVILS